MCIVFRILRFAKLKSPLIRQIRLIPDSESKFRATNCPNLLAESYFLTGTTNSKSRIRILLRASTESGLKWYNMPKLRTRVPDLNILESSIWTQNVTIYFNVICLLNGNCASNTTRKLLVQKNIKLGYYDFIMYFID